MVNGLTCIRLSPLSAPESLLTVESAKELFNVADTAKLQFAGIKLLEIDANADANHRIAILRDGITALNKARQ